MDAFGLPEGLFGLLLLFEAIGGVLAVAVVDRLRRRFGTGRTMATAAVIGSLSFLLPWAVPQVWALALALLVSSAGLVIWNVLIISLRQAAIPTHLLGRVHGTWRTLHWGALPRGALVGGLIGRVDSTLPILVGGGAAAIGALLLSRRFSRSPSRKTSNGRHPTRERRCATASTQHGDRRTLLTPRRRASREARSIR